MKIRLLLALIVFSIISCNKKTGHQTVSVKGKYQIELPESFKKVKGLNEDASLEYQDLRKELYVIVIDESIRQFDSIINAHSLYDTYTADLQGYSELIIDGIDPSVTIDSISVFREVRINNLDARRVTMTGSTAGYNIYWNFAFLEGKNSYYQLMVWTREGNQNKYMEEIDGIIESFRETDRSKKE